MVNLGSTWGQPGVNLGSTWGQPGVNMWSTCTAQPVSLHAKPHSIVRSEEHLVYRHGTGNGIAELRCRPEPLGRPRRVRVVVIPKTDSVFFSNPRVDEDDPHSHHRPDVPPKSDDGLDVTAQVENESDNESSLSFFCFKR